MNKTNLLIIGLIVLLTVLGIRIYSQNESSQVVIDDQPPVVNVPPTPVKVPIVHYPVTEPAAPEEPAPQEAQEPIAAAPASFLPEVLPEMQNSDTSLQKVLTEIDTDASYLSLLILDNFIPKFVVTIDNLPEKKLPQAHLPLKSPKGRFLVSGTTEAPQTSRRNQQRYEVYVKFLESLDPTLIVKIYNHYYPLFQSAYKQLGYRNAYFNDRLVQVLDHLQETPDTAEPLSLSQPSVLFTFTDPSLEKLSSGQKILLRIGPDYRRRILKLLAIYRKALVK